VVANTYVDDVHSGIGTVAAGVAVKPLEDDRTTQN
jgi:hypothetical protein